MTEKLEDKGESIVRTFSAADIMMQNNEGCGRLKTVYLLFILDLGTNFNSAVFF